MARKWIHLNTEVGDPWILPIWRAVNDAESSGKASRISERVKSQLGLSISTRLDMLPRIIRRINDEVNQVYEATKSHKEEHICTESKEGFVFTIEEDLKFNLLIDIDSLLFELNSVCELIMRLFFELYTHIGKNIKNKELGLLIKRIIEDAGQSSDWFKKLDTQRNLFMHLAAPYFAVDISEGPGNFDLLIMNENVKLFDDYSKFIKLSDINSIVKGFSVAKTIIQEHLIEEYQGKP